MTSAQDLVSDVYGDTDCAKVHWRSELFFDINAAIGVMRAELEEIARQFLMHENTASTRMAMQSRIRAYLARLYVCGRLYEEDGFWHVEAAPKPVPAQPVDPWDEW